MANPKMEYRYDVGCAIIAGSCKRNYDVSEIMMMTARSRDGIARYLDKDF